MLVYGESELGIGPVNLLLLRDLWNGLNKICAT
jgi:hypothetical protein